MITAGIDVGSSAVKTVFVDHGGEEPTILAHRSDRVRHRNIVSVVEESYEAALKDAGIQRDMVDYVATTGEGELVTFRTGHFYGMTTHAKGGVFLIPGASAVLDVGALHARAIVCDANGRVKSYRMTSQCASGSGQFIENISRYLGVAIEEVGPLSLEADEPEKCSSICAVLAETDVINMVSRGISISNILKGIHQSMAGRFVKLLRAAKAEGTVAVTGGLASDVGLLAALDEAANKGKKAGLLKFVARPEAAIAGALGAALWAKYRIDKLARLEADSQGMATA